MTVLMADPSGGGHVPILDPHLPLGDASAIGQPSETVARGKDGRTFPVELTISEADAGSIKFSRFVELPDGLDYRRGPLQDGVSTFGGMMVAAEAPRPS